MTPTDTPARKIVGDSEKPAFTIGIEEEYMVLDPKTYELKSHIDVWGEVGPAAALMHALKEKFDPQNLLNPGRFVAGI